MRLSDIPTGSDSDTVEKYFDHLYGYYIKQFKFTFRIIPISLFWVLFYLAVLSGFLFFGAMWQRKTRARSEPYPVETYDGYISEGNGPVGRFLWLFFAGIFLWCVGITVMSLTEGQIY